MHGDANYIGMGLYTLPDAARFLGVHATRLRRWVDGYTQPTDQSRGRRPPVWTRQLPPMDGQIVLGFQDLMEAKFVTSFRQHGVSWKIIRQAAEQAARLLKTDHPFSRHRFLTDGQKIFTQIIHKDGEVDLIELQQMQHHFDHIVTPKLIGSLEFEGESVSRWWPLGKDHHVRLDPKTQFGAPVTIEGVPTEIIANAYKKSQSYEEVADWYEIEKRSVVDAVKFEQQLGRGKHAA